MLCSAWSITSDALEIVGSPAAMFKQALYVPRKFDAENIAAHVDETIELSKKDAARIGFRTMLHTAGGAVRRATAMEWRRADGYFRRHIISYYFVVGAAAVGWRQLR